MLAMPFALFAEILLRVYLVPLVSTCSARRRKVVECLRSTEGSSSEAGGQTTADTDTDRLEHRHRDTQGLIAATDGARAVFDLRSAGRGLFRAVACVCVDFSCLPLPMVLLATATATGALNAQSFASVL